MAHETQPIPRWTSRPVLAWVVRAVLLLAPLVGSAVFVHFATRLVGPPTSSLWLFLTWWFGLVVCATLVLIGIAAWRAGSCRSQRC